MTPPIEVAMKLKICYFFSLKSAPNLLGGLVYHVTSLSVRSTVVYAHSSFISPLYCSRVPLSIKSTGNINCTFVVFNKTKRPSKW